ncbi:MAG: aldo/keto reductase [Sphingomonas fennica]
MAGKRHVGPFAVEPVALGCMSLSHAYGVPPSEEEGERLIARAIDIGVDFLDTAALYGMGHNERLVGRALKGKRDRVTLASKCGLRIIDGERRIDGSAEGVRIVLDDSLQRLGVDVIDLYYLHRVDPAVPIEESVGALADGVKAGKVRAIGLSEASAETLRRANAVHPIAAMQSEYSLWTRNPEIAVLEECRKLGTAFVAFSPVGRGFLSDRDVDLATLPDNDVRQVMPRFKGEDNAANRALLPAFRRLAERLGMSAAQLAIAWVLARAPHIVALPGTASIAHLEEDFAARDIVLDAATMAELDGIIHRGNVRGARYSPPVQKMIDTEEFAD